MAKLHESLPKIKIGINLQNSFHEKLEHTLSSKAKCDTNWLQNKEGTTKGTNWLDTLFLFYRLVLWY